MTDKPKSAAAQRFICKECGHHTRSNAHKRACSIPEQAPKPKKVKPVVSSNGTSEQPLRLFISPMFRGEDKGDGGVRRGVELQHAILPSYGIEVVDKSEDADILVVHIQERAKWLRRHSDKPLVADCHGLYWAEYDWPNWCLKANRLVMETIRQADAIVAHSEWVAQAIRRHTLRQVEVIYHGINPAVWRSSSQSRGYVLWNKNRPDPICDPGPAMELAEKMPDVSFVTTFGATPDQEEGVYENVTVTGRLPFEEAKEYVEEAGVYLCTVRETFGIGTLEAMAAGVPVVGWNWGGQREILKMFPGSMVLVDPGDVDGLEKAVRVALEEGATVEAGLKAAQHFNEQKIAAQYAEFLRGVYARWQQEHKAPRTSIVVTAYNLAQYLPACLDSLLMQEDEDWECIIVDDASPDDSGKIAEEYGVKDRRFRVIHNEENQYLAGARNTGIAAARGRYILPLDADDMLGPKAVGVLADALDQDRSNHIVYGNVRFVDEDGATPTDYKVKDQEPGHSGWPIAFRYDWQVDLGRNLLPYCSMLRKSVWDLTGGYRRRCRTAEDAEFWSRAASFGFRPAMVTDEDTLVYRNREDSMSRREGETDWTAWFPWHYEAILRPAGALTEEQAPVHSCDPPLIAVVIPVGPGHEELLWDALDSVEAQTFRQWECIVVNDTGAPLRQLPSWVTLLETEGERGVATCRNMALEVARAKFFLPLDADDYMQPTCLKRLLDAHMETGDPIVYSDWYDEAPDKKWSIYEAPDYDARLLTRNGCIHAVTALYLRKLWQDLGGFDETLLAWEDWDFQIAAAARGACSTRVPLPLWVYRKGTGYRREENYADFEDSKNGILAKWGRFFRGEEILMACSGCSKKRAAPVPVVAHKSSAAPATQGAVLFEYTGKATGRKRYRAPSGQTYVFAALPSHKQKWVLGDDVGFFDGLQGFQRIEQAGQVPEEAAMDPALVAEGPPVH